MDSNNYKLNKADKANVHSNLEFDNEKTNFKRYSDFRGDTYQKESLHKINDNLRLDKRDRKKHKRKLSNFNINSIVFYEFKTEFLS